MRTILIPIFQSFISRSILITDTFKKLSSAGLRIVLLVPDYKKDFYLENFGKENVIIESVDDQKLRKLSSKFMQKLAISLLPTYFVKYRNRKRLERNPLLWLLNSLVIYFFGPFKISHKVFRFFDRLTMDTALFDGYFERYKPDAVFATDIFSPADAHLLRSAEKHGVRSIGMVRSWDCPTNKNLLRIIPSKVLANNEANKKELVRFHDVEEDRIQVVGFPQFDPYFTMKPSPRKDFFSTFGGSAVGGKKIGVSLDKRLILFAPAGSALADIDWQYCEILDGAQKEGRIPADIVFLVRKHPQDTTDLSKFEDKPNFVIEQPGRSFGGRTRATEIDLEATQHLIDSVCHSKLLISVNTTLGLDAVIFDKPHIILAFDGYEKRPFLKSVRRYQREDNTKAFTDTGAVRMANNPEELVYWINRYLEDPGTDKEGRERARKETLSGIDGKSGERIADAVLEFIG